MTSRVCQVCYENEPWSETHDGSLKSVGWHRCSWRLSSSLIPQFAEGTPLDHWSWSTFDPSRLASTRRSWSPHTAADQDHQTGRGDLWCARSISPRLRLQWKSTVGDISDTYLFPIRWRRLFEEECQSSRRLCSWSRLSAQWCQVGPTWYMSCQILSVHRRRCTRSSRPVRPVQRAWSHRRWHLEKHPEGILGQSCRPKAPASAC